MTGHRVGTREEWNLEREALLVEEKELTRARDALAADADSLAVSTLVGPTPG